MGADIKHVCFSLRPPSLSSSSDGLCFDFLC